MKRYFPLICFAFFQLALLCLAQQAGPPRKPLSPENWSKLHEGDIVFIRSRSENAALIADLSNLNAKADADNVFTHCGIVFKDAGDGKLKIYEGAGMVNQRSTVGEWQARESGAGIPLHNVYVMRWKGPPELNASMLNQITNTAKALHDTTYDKGFSWSNAHAYCSELVWKAFAGAGLTLGELPKMKHYVDGVSPDLAKQIKAKLNNPVVMRDYRAGKGYDPEESAISPEDIFNTPALIPVNDDSP